MPLAICRSCSVEEAEDEQMRSMDMSTLEETRMHSEKLWADHRFSPRKVSCFACDSDLDGYPDKDTFVADCADGGSIHVNLAEGGTCYGSPRSVSAAARAPALW
eukprot:CAMPEP_0194479062 /NCGR_PEP_ID=MMETSP0253-20130528/2310_1 /TAXON_ID=2966 /ORGANISM="Noctiluca scintillans" /LENGTH=103 /DNA_ID=CAMNT_0039318233 /DNA_START=48 /DNA_END=359 /DNA_ORIENTATION=+